MKQSRRLRPDSLTFVAGVALVVAVAALVAAGLALGAAHTATTAPSPSVMAAPKAAMYVYTAWARSWHSNTQADVAKELADERTGQTADEVIHGSDPEDCIACHAPTAVLANGGMTETQALNHFFTTSGGKVTNRTAAAHADDWPNVACAVCHNPAYPPNGGTLSYFDSSTGQYEPMRNADELCGQCHGNLRFPDTDHLSYNILRGTGGIGVRKWQTMGGIPCTSCHMFMSPVAGSNSAQLAGHSLAITVREADGKMTSSCTQSQCHSNWTAAQAMAAIAADKSDFVALDEIAQESVAAAAGAMRGVADKTLQAKLAEAEHNLQYAESDESGGFHNHVYLMELLRDANDKADQILSALGRSSA